MLFLGIDAGTTALKVGLFDEHGMARAIVSEEYSLITPAADQVEFEPENYWNACVKAVRRVIAQANAQREEIVAITVSSQGQTTIAVDEQGRALRPALVWLDNRATAQAKKIAAHFDPREVYAATGNSDIVPMWTACKILWLKENEPDICRRAFKFLLVEDFLLYRLSGRFATDGAIACSSLLWDARRGTWWDEMLSFLEITPDRLAEPVLPGGIVGTLRRESAELLGLSPNTRIIAGGVDLAAGAVGAGNIRPGIVSESTGGSLAIQATIPAHGFDSTSTIPVNVHVVPGAFLFVAVCSTGGMALRWFRDQFAQEEIAKAREQDRDAYQLLDELAASVAPGCEGLTMLPHLMGASSPENNVNARGVFYGFTLRHTKAHFVRAILEANAFMLKRNLDLMASVGVAVRQVFSTGGGAKSALWRQIKADVTSVPVAVLEQSETTILGDAILAAVAMGRYKNLDEACEQMVRVRAQIEPHPATHQAYERAYASYLSLYEHVEDLFKQG
jgi:xylulokinase